MPDHTMQLRVKIVVVLILVLLVYTGTAWVVLSSVQGPSFAALEQQAVRESVERARHGIDMVRQQLATLAIDWGAWDEAWQFVADENETFYSENLGDAYLATLGLSFAVFLTPDGEIYWAEAYRSRDGAPMPIETLFPDGFSPEGPLFERDSAGGLGMRRGFPLVNQPMVEATQEIISGLVQTELGPAVIAVSPILDSEAMGPSRGFFLIGRLLDDQGIAELNERTVVDADLLALDPPTPFPDTLLQGDGALEIEVGKDTVTGYLPLRDVALQPIGVLRIEMPRRITNLGARTLSNSLGLLLLSALIVTACLWSLLQHLMLNPIERITQVLRSAGSAGDARDEDEQFRASADALAEIEKLEGIAARKDEIGELARALNGLGRSMHQASSRIWRIAHIDGLTGVPNRRWFMQQLRAELDAARGEVGRQVAILFVDLDDFKQVNDGLGHEVGDRLLIELVGRIRALLGTGSGEDGDGGSSAPAMARLGGDEFMIMLSGTAVGARAPVLAAALVEAIGAPFQIEGRRCQVSASLGLALFPQHGQHMEELLRQADAAMYVAKKRGKNSWHSYQPGDHG